MAYRRRRTFKRRNGRKRQPLKKLIRREISRACEKKSRQHFAMDATIYSSADAGPLDASIIPVAPTNGYLDIQQGTGAASRIGNRITTKRLMFKGTIVPNVYDTIFNPIVGPMQVKMWLFYNKIDPTNLPTPAVDADFYQNNNSEAGFTNDLIDLWKPVNTDLYRVLASRTFKLGSAIPTTSSDTTASYVGSNNDFKYNCNFNINLTKMIPKITRYNDNNIDPTTRGLYCLFVAYRANGGAFTASARPARVSYMLDYTYEDA